MRERKQLLQIITLSGEVTVSIPFEFSPVVIFFFFFNVGFSNSFCHFIPIATFFFFFLNEILLVSSYLTKLAHE